MGFSRIYMRATITLAPHQMDGLAGHNFVRAGYNLVRDLRATIVRPNGRTPGLRPYDFSPACQAFIATLLFDPSMSALPIIVKQNSPSVGLFTHQ